MEIEELTHEQRIESYIDTRLKSMFENKEKVEFTKKELAEFCLKEIDYSINILESTDIEEQFEE